MTVSVFSVIMGIVCASLVLWAGGLLIQYGKRIRWEFIGFLLILGFIRLFLPVEMIGITVIDDWNVYPVLWRIFVDSRIFGLPIYAILLVIWAGGSVISLLLFWHKKYLLRQIIAGATIVSPDDRVYDFCKEAAAHLHFKGEMKVLITGEISIPLSAGVVSPVILIPEQMLDFPEVEFVGIIRHELTHYLRGDVGKQRILNWLQCLFWWNPVIYYVKDCFEQMIELQCDAKVCEGKTKEEKKIYLNGILRVLRLGQKKPPNLGVGYAKDNTEAFLKRRFYEVLEPTPKHSWTATLELAAVCVALFFASYLFVVQPAALPPESELQNIRMTSSKEEVTDFLLRLSDGSYMYMKDMVGAEILTEEQIQEAPYRELPIFDSIR